MAVHRFADASDAGDGDDAAAPLRFGSRANGRVETPIGTNDGGNEDDDDSSEGDDDSEDGADDNANMSPPLL